MRIIGGQWKRTPLPVMDAQGLRPTPDRVRETLFNWLQHLLGGAWADVACLDVFAGSGALGFEAASRGARRVLMIEENPAALRHLQASRAKLNAEQVEIRRGDALAAARSLAKDGATFDLVFLDPPYHQDWLVRMLPVCEYLLTEGGYVYAECELRLNAEPPPPWMHGWDVVRADKAGTVFYHLLQRNTERQFEA